MIERLCLFVATMLGLGALANGVFMLVSPQNWYVAVPGVTTTGPFNQHFLRDIGLIFLFVGAAFLTGVRVPAWRLSLWAAASIWLIGHALFHVWEVAAGICGPAVLLRDFPAVSFPALMAAALTVWAAYERRAMKENEE